MPLVYVPELHIPVYVVAFQVLSESLNTFVDFFSDSTHFHSSSRKFFKINESIQFRKYFIKILEVIEICTRILSIVLWTIKGMLEFLKTLENTFFLTYWSNDFNNFRTRNRCFCCVEPISCDINLFQLVGQ